MLPTSSISLPAQERRRSDPIAVHPLSPDLDRLGELSEYLAGRIGQRQPGWIPLRRLTSDRLLIEDVLKRNELAYQGTRRIAANFVAGGITWAATAAAVAVMSTQKRAISPDPERTFIRVDERGEARGVVFQDPDFCVLPSDPVAIHERAHVAEDVAAMHEWMRARMVAYLTPLVDALSDLSGLGRKGLWGQVAASWGSVITWAAELTDSGDGVAEAETFLDAPGPAFSNVPTFFRIDHASGKVVAMRRGVCCLAYKLSGHGYCGTCPLISEEERARRFCGEAQ